ncbi:MAG: phage regulatory CII family protein [Acidobacteriota bacterium]
MTHSSMHEAIRTTITESEAPPKSIATDIGIPYATLMSYSYEPGENDGARGLPARLIVPLIKASGNTAILDFLEAAVGRIAFDIPRPDAPPELAIKSAGLIAKEAGEVIETIADAILDGRITKAEAHRIQREAKDAIRELARALAVVDRVMVAKR